jgi:hypothetical protein
MFHTKAAIQLASSSLCKRVWFPAFAGKTEVRKQGPLRRFAPLPREGEDLALMIFPLWGKYRHSRGRGSCFTPKPQQKASPRIQPGEAFCRGQYGAQERTRTSTTFRSLAPEASASTNSATWALCPAGRIKAGAVDRASLSSGQCSFWRQMTLIGAQGRLGRCAGRAARLSRGQQGRFAGS